MGLESQCQCIWTSANSTSAKAAPAEAKVLLEATELILRGGIRKRIALTEMREVRATAHELSFHTNEGAVTLRFPTAIAEAWAKRILAPPVTLATKLGIREGTAVLLTAGSTSAELQAAVDLATAASWTACDLAIAEVETEDELSDVLNTATNKLGSKTPLWIVYRKGPGQPVNEALVRAKARALGWMDTKVSSVSSVWTALKFNRPGQSPRVRNGEVTH